MANGVGKLSGKLLAGGMAWSAIATVGGKLMSLASQIALGYLLSVETYAVFAAATACLVFATGLQNSGVSKLLIQRPERHEEMASVYAGFSVILGLVAMLAMLPIGYLFSRLNGMPELVWVVALASITIPFYAFNSVQTTGLSIGLRFSKLSRVFLFRDFLYYVVLVLAALVGFASFSIAFASVVSVLTTSVLLVMFYTKLTPDLRSAATNFWSIAGDVRWTVISGYLFGLSHSGDYLVLGALLSTAGLGTYYFGYMLAGNIGNLASLAITQTLMPAFSNLNTDRERLRRAVLKSSGVIVAIAGLLSIGILGLGPTFVHHIWGGRWDGAIFVCVAISATFPIRILATLGAVMLESQAQWKTRTLLLAYDAVGLMLFAAVGAVVSGVNGAAVGVGIHRGLTGMVIFPVGTAHIGIGAKTTWLFVARYCGAFILAATLIYGARSLATTDALSFWPNLALTLAACVVFSAFVMEAMVNMLGVLRRK